MKLMVVLIVVMLAVPMLCVAGDGDDSYRVTLGNGGIENMYIHIKIGIPGVWQWTLIIDTEPHYPPGYFGPEPGW